MYMNRMEEFVPWMKYNCGASHKYQSHVHKDANGSILHETGLGSF